MLFECNEKKFYKSNFCDKVVEKTNFNNCLFVKCNFKRIIFSDVYFERTEFLNCNFEECFFTSSNLFSEVRFQDCSGYSCSFSGAVFFKTKMGDNFFYKTNFSYATFKDCYFAELCEMFPLCDFSGAKFHGPTPFYNYHTPSLCPICPEEGSFIGFKKGKGGYIIKLLIPEDAKRSNATTRKCRCDKAVVLEISNGAQEVKSFYDDTFVYRVGETVSVDNFDENRWNECASGIHFFLTRKEAEDFKV